MSDTGRPEPWPVQPISSRYHATCKCGWIGPARRSRNAACADEAEHRSDHDAE